MRECAWRFAPASVGTYVQVGPTSILVLQLYFCQHLILDFVNSINYNHLAHINVLYTVLLSRLLRSKRQRGRHKQTVYRSFHMHSAVTCTSAHPTGTIRAVFSTSKVCQDALFIKHIYAQDDYNWMNEFNQVSYVGKNTDIIATLRWVRLVHTCQIVKYWKQIESIRAFMRECAWNCAPASVGIDVQVGPTSILVL